MTEQGQACFQSQGVGNTPLVKQKPERHKMEFMSNTEYENINVDVFQASAFLKAMANENRILILRQLLQGETSVATLRKIIPVSQSGLSQHLGKLLQGNLVRVRKVAQSSFYTLSDEGTNIVAETLGAIFTESTTFIKQPPAKAR